MNLLEVMQNRHSVRKYTGEPIEEEKLTAILQAGLMSASGKAIRPWELIVIKDRAILDKLVGCRTGSAKMFSGAAAAVVVVANEDLTDVWVEDCSVVMANMHLMADCLGLGSCWIQGRLRNASEEQTTEDYVQKLLEIPGNYRLEAILSLGIPESHPAKTELAALPMEKIHWEKF